MSNFEKIVQREQGLRHNLTASQMAMIAIGGAIGTGLFLGSGFAISIAGPSVLITYAIGAAISLILMGCLAEMTVAHPTSGSFGAYAEFYISPLAGFLVRYAYWSCIVLAIGTEVTAIGKYMAMWFPQISPWIWVVSFSLLLICVNALSVKAFGSIEYIFSSIKIIAIIVFIVIACIIIFFMNRENIGFQNYYNNGGFLPHGLSGMWSAIIIALFSYISIEMIAVAAGEAKNPQTAISSAFRSTMIRLIIFYILTLALMLAILPWQMASESKSPFVMAMEIIGIPGAAHIINFIVLIAALSAMNSQLYTSTRMMFSLSRANFAPKIFGNLSKRGVPIFALFLSCVGIAIAAFLNFFWAEKAFLLMISLSVFGALFTWLMIFVTHFFFRLKRKKENISHTGFRMWGFPYFTLLGAALMLAAIITTYFVEAFRPTLLCGIPFLFFLTACYYFFKKDYAINQ